MLNDLNFSQFWKVYLFTYSFMYFLFISTVRNTGFEDAKLVLPIL